ncbi:MAG: hypothetical protein IT326_03870, partial [Anaerolineae bacterium]|nr:hypothetical protein [Anaerolineae bacterium]
AIWSVVMAAVGVAFLGAYLMNRQNWGFLIPAYVFFAIAALIFVATRGLLRGEMIGAFVMSLVGLPFLFVWTRAPKQNWWALIPAYVMFTIAVFLLLVNILPGVVIGGFWVLAVALPFFVVYIVNPRNNWWALIPGGILGATGVGLSIASGLKALNAILPIALILGGAYLLFNQVLRRTGLAVPPTVPTSGPAADRPPQGPDKPLE